MINLFIYFLHKKGLKAIAGRARIEQQKQAALKNIQKNKEAALKQLDIQYASADKAKKSFGYIGITFLACLFGSIFVNDLMKLGLYYFDHLRDWWQRKQEMKEVRQSQDKENKDEIVLKLDQICIDELEDSLEKVYFKLVKANAKNRQI